MLPLSQKREVNFYSTVDLTRFFLILNHCEKKRGSTNEHAASDLLQKQVIFHTSKKTFFVITPQGRFPAFGSEKTGCGSGWSSQSGEPQLFANAKNERKKIKANWLLVAKNLQPIGGQWI